MSIKAKDIFNAIIIFIISVIFVSDLFINKGRPASFDEPTHLANIAFFFKSISQGQWHVTWTDGFANYGMPLGIIAQQVTSYLGAWINLIVHNVVLSYNMVVWIGAFLSALFFYFFLRLYFKPESSLVGAFLFNFAPYRIINIYIRGAVPEFFGSVPLPLMLIGIYWIFHKRAGWGFALLTISTAILILIHPMMVVISSFILVPYLLFCFLEKKEIKPLIICGLAAVLGFGLSGYYIIPLLIEIKYFFYGLGKNHFIPNQFMSFDNFFDPRWYYFYKNDIFPRGHFIQAGLLEMIIFITGVLFIIWSIVKKKMRFNLFVILIIAGLLMIFLMTKWGVPFYKIDMLSNIQYQWRLFSAFIFIPPFIIAYLSDKFNSKLFIYALILLICVMRFPQLYGKNYTVYPEQSYFFTPENLHANIMNIIWTSETRYYPIKKQKPEIIAGTGTITQNEVKDTVRNYTISAISDLRMADNTFYFPGWHVYIDGHESVIQFQDPSYRGTITYWVPSGTHQVLILFKNTKVRTIAIFTSLISLVAFFFAIFYFHKFQKVK